LSYTPAQLSDELGFKKWFVDLYKKHSNANVNLNSKREITAESIYIDFDTTQTEFDYILNLNSLKTKYGLEYTSNDWKTKRKSNYYGTGESHFDIDWSNYNDNLDMDQQSIDFWNQF